MASFSDNPRCKNNNNKTCFPFLKRRRFAVHEFSHLSTTDNGTYGVNIFLCDKETSYNIELLMEFYDQVQETGVTSQVGMSNSAHTLQLPCSGPGGQATLVSARNRQAGAFQEEK